jgi:transposase-like protein
MGILSTTSPCFNILFIKPAAETVDRFRFDLWNYKAYPKAHWKRIRTTNVIEQVNKELKRRSRSVGAFPSDKSLMRLAGCILINIDEEGLRVNSIYRWTKRNDSKTGVYKIQKK